MGIPGILTFPPYRISCRISLAHPPDIAGHKWDILAISIAARVALVKVSDRNSFRANQIHSDSFRNLFPRQTELIRINPKKVFNLV